MSEELFEFVLDAVRDWVPKGEYPNETGYRNDLANYLRNEFKRALEEGDASRMHKVKKEHGRSLADIAIDERIGIELKKDLKNRKEIDRLSGQLRRFMKNYSDAVVVLCGDISEEAYEECMELQQTADLLDEGGNVIIARKDKKKLIEDKKKEEEEEFDFW